MQIAVNPEAKLQRLRRAFVSLVSIENLLITTVLAAVILLPFGIGLIIDNLGPVADIIGLLFLCIGLPALFVVLGAIPLLWEGYSRNYRVYNERETGYGSSKTCSQRLILVANYFSEVQHTLADIVELNTKKSFLASASQQAKQVAEQMEWEVVCYLDKVRPFLRKGITGNSLATIKQSLEKFEEQRKHMETLVATLTDQSFKTQIIQEPVGHVQIMHNEIEFMLQGLKEADEIDIRPDVVFYR